MLSVCMYMYDNQIFFVLSAVRVISNESRRLFIPRTNCLKICNFVYEEGGISDAFIETRYSRLILKLPDAGVSS